MRLLALLLAAGVLALQGWFAADTAGASARVVAKAEAIAALGDPDASEMAFGVVIDLYPFSAAAFSARRQLALLDGGLSVRSRDLLGLTVRDDLSLGRRPWVGPAGVLSVAVLVLLLALLQPRSRVRLLAGLTLLGLLVASAMSQGWLPMPSAPDDGFSDFVSGQAEALGFAAFPWMTLAALAAGFVLQLVPRRRSS